jgi:putative transposase
MLESNKRINYSSDLLNDEWEIIKPHIPTPRTNIGRKRVHSYREILNVIFYLLRSGCAWRLLPHEFPHWKTVYHYFRVWQLNGTWEQINAALRTDLRVAYGRK